MFEAGKEYKTRIKDGMDLIPPKKVGYVNIYDGMLAVMYSTKDEADEAAGHDRVACIRIEYHDGQFDE